MIRILQENTVCIFLLEYFLENKEKDFYVIWKTGKRFYGYILIFINFEFSESYLCLLGLMSLRVYTKRKKWYRTFGYLDPRQTYLKFHYIKENKREGQRNGHHSMVQLQMWPVDFVRLCLRLQKETEKPLSPLRPESVDMFRLYVHFKVSPVHSDMFIKGSKNC